MDENFVFREMVDLFDLVTTSPGGRRGNTDTASGLPSKNLLGAFSQRHRAGGLFYLPPPAAFPLFIQQMRQLTFMFNSLNSILLFPLLMSLLMRHCQNIDHFQLPNNGILKNNCCKQSVFPSELLNLSWQSPLLANTRKYCKLTGQYEKILASRGN